VGGIVVSAGPSCSIGDFERDFEPGRGGISGTADLEGLGGIEGGARMMTGVLCV